LSIHSEVHLRLSGDLSSCSIDALSPLLNAAEPSVFAPSAKTRCLASGEGNVKRLHDIEPPELRLRVGDDPNCPCSGRVTAQQEVRLKEEH
jgi:hypothetical protein